MIPRLIPIMAAWVRSEEHTSELQSRSDLVCRLLLEKKKKENKKRKSNYQLEKEMMADKDKNGRYNAPVIVDDHVSLLDTRQTEMTSVDDRDAKLTC